MGEAKTTSKYKDDCPRRAEFFCATEGFTDAKLARLFGVSEPTIARWKVKHAKFANAVKRGKECSREWMGLLALRSQKKLIEGFNTVEITREPAMSFAAMLVETMPKNKKTKKGKKKKNTTITARMIEKAAKLSSELMVVTKKITKRVAPSASAIRLELTSRNPEYRQKVDFKHSGAVDTSGISDAERGVLKELAVKRAAEAVKSAKEQAA